MSPSAYDVVSLVQFCYEPRDLCRVVLKVAIHRYDDFASSVLKSCFQRSGLSEIFSQQDCSHTRVVLTDFGKDCGCIVATTVVNKQDLVAVADPPQCLYDPRVEDAYVVLFVIERNNDGILDRHHS